MKFSSCLNYITLGLFAATPTLSCLHTQGEIYISNTGHVTDLFLVVVDNGTVVCGAINSDEWRIDQDGHISTHCLDGYVYAVDVVGYEAWYRNKDGGTFSWKNERKTTVSGDGSLHVWWSFDLFCGKSAEGAEVHTLSQDEFIAAAI